VATGSGAPGGHYGVTGSRLKRVEARLKPFIGSIGVAPRFGRIETTLAPGEYGGNMDCVETCEGTTVYLPVWVRGAYLAFGDVHALQGDGELNGTALEVTPRSRWTWMCSRGNRLNGHVWRMIHTSWLPAALAR